MKKLLLLFTAILMVSCGDNSKAELVQPTATGTVKNVMLVISDELWKGEVGDALRELINEPLVGLPQPEPAFKITRVQPIAFKGMLRNNRNVLFVDLYKTAGYSVKHNVHANGQTVVSMLAKTKPELLKMVQENGKNMLKTFNDADVKFIQKRQAKDATTRKLIALENLGIKMTIPKTFRTVIDTVANGNGFLWIRHRLGKGDTMELLAYDVPIKDESDLLGNNIIANRNAIGQQYIVGEKDGMYMITEEAYSPYRFDTTIDGKKAFETRGKWEMKDDFMAGPFLNYTIVDKPNNRLVVVEGFVFAPAKDKRNYLFDLESIMKSLTFTK